MIDLAAWRATWNELGAHSPDEALHQQLIACWSEEHRRYHTLQHLREAIEHLQRARADAERPAEIALALWFHDAVYDPRRQDNEERSAQWARECARRSGLAEDVAQRVHDLVMATRHEHAPTDADAQLLVDIDLSILGASPARFDESCAQVRQEYAHVPEQDYRQGRSRVLRHFLDRPRLYNTQRFRSTLDAPARENLKRALDRLNG